MKETRVTVYNSSEKASGYVPDTVPELIKWLTAKLQTVPEEYHENLQFDQTAEQEYDCAYTVTEIYYYRPETPEEQAAKKEEERARLEKLRAQELAQLAALKKKYES